MVVTCQLAWGGSSPQAPSQHKEAAVPLLIQIELRENGVLSVGVSSPVPPLIVHGLLLEVAKLIAQGLAQQEKESSSGLVIPSIVPPTGFVGG